MRSQIVTSKGRGGRRYLPYAFTEHGAIVDVLQKIMELLNPPPQPEPPRKQIGFQVKERKARYSVAVRKGR